MGINSRAKGNKNERDLSKVIEKWTGKTFSRVPSSGGLNWKAGLAKGDIVCSEEGHFFPFCIEAKNYKDINFEHLLYLPKPKIMEFWAQCTRDARICKKSPLLFMRYNRLPKDFHFVVIDDIFWKNIVSYYVDPEDRYIRIPSLGITIITTKLLTSIPYKEIRKQVKTLYRK